MSSDGRRKLECFAVSVEKDENLSDLAVGACSVFDNDDFEAGDLGLGRGVKPGSLLDDVTHCNVLPFCNMVGDGGVTSDATSGYSSSRTNSTRGSDVKADRRKCCAGDKIGRSLSNCSNLTKEGIKICFPFLYYSIYILMYRYNWSTGPKSNF